MRKNQKGVVLIIGLLMLMMLALVTVAASQRSQLEERVTGNSADVDVAFQAAEGALREAESFLQNTATLPPFDATAGLYQPANPGGQSLWKTVDWSSSAATRTFSAMSGAPGSLQRAQARYLIEELPRVVSPGNPSLSVDTPYTAGSYYRITAQGIGSKSVGTVTLQTTYKR